MCQQCAGAHRSLGTHISKVRHLALDTDAWTDPVKKLFQHSGNAQGNAIWQGGAGNVSAAGRALVEREAQPSEESFDQSKSSEEAETASGESRDLSIPNPYNPNLYIPKRFRG